MAGLASTLTVATVGLTCKAVLNVGLCSIQVNNLHILLDALDHPERRNGRGLVTVSNHVSTLDDPLTWGILPARCYFSSRSTRWALGASDIIFTNPLFSTFFRLGQTLETFRGQGVYQESVNTAIQKLNEGAWVHLFGEGKVNQTHSYPLDSKGLAHLPRFKWGVGRMIMDTTDLPIVIPMWLSGYDRLMPERRPFPQKYLPRFGTRLSVTFGNPVSPDLLSSAIRGPTSNDNLEPTIDARRSHLTSIIQDQVESLGRVVSGRLLAEKP